MSCEELVFPKEWNMSTLKKLTCLTLALSLGACNEKVSPELQGGAATSTTTGSTSPVIPPDSFYFKVTNSADTMLNFKLHKTGAGNADKNCEITSSTELSSDKYRSDLATYDITCYLEAEELVLNHNGLEYSVEASQNTCQYIGYSPYSYYNFQPGSSSQTVHTLDCSGVTNAQYAAAKLVIPELGAIANDTCASARNPAAPADIDIESEADFCSFDYSSIKTISEDGAPNCDEGVLNVTAFNLVGEDSDNNGSPDEFTLTKNVKTVKCNGKAANCIQGPIKEISSLSKFTSGIEVTRAKVNTPYSTKYTLPKLFGRGLSNIRYANFRRDLASTEIEYGNSDRSSGTLSSSYLSSFGDPLYLKSYNPDIVSMYSNNKRMDGSVLVTSPMITARRFDYLKGSNVSSTAFAAEPFLGLGNGYKTNPFYTFYCYDNAYDVKARIRMVVRDWDRTLPSSATSSAFERISDADLLPPMARQDVPYTQEITGDPDSWNDFNDIFDWDDLIDMERDDANIPYDPSITVYRPYPKGNFVNGFLNPYNFPMELER